ncbi:hypothetical protein CPB84DRAFT_1842506 [Gymnopilus junonius]|uniref:Uncharacterized protein n=1 Tax=Gymnopilus junonius TaxID=109634 RepID=A0A9P5TS15_GYMJU|nr:hypothetical protein CPB84DRAFT_1842506 [Gymnopilus junonius]
MNPSTQMSDGLSEGRPSDTSLGTFVKELAVTLREVNSSVMLMTQYIVDGVLNETMEGNADTATAAVPSAASGSNTVIAAPIHAPLGMQLSLAVTPAFFKGPLTSLPTLTVYLVDWPSNLKWSRGKSKV